MTRPNCGCCSTGAEYVRRHLDQANMLPPDIDARVLAQGMAQLVEEQGCIPVHFPDVRTLEAWIRECQQQKRTELRSCA
jgi:hypothetical protein